MNKTKPTKGDGWVKIYETDRDSDGNTFFVVEFGKSGFPAHYRQVFDTKKEAEQVYKAAK
jgi:hypothetical protein